MHRWSDWISASHFLFPWCYNVHLYTFSCQWTFLYKLNMSPVPSVGGSWSGQTERAALPTLLFHNTYICTNSCPFPGGWWQWIQQRMCFFLKQLWVIKSQCRKVAVAVKALVCVQRQNEERLMQMHWCVTKLCYYAHSTQKYSSMLSEGWYWVSVRTSQLKALLFSSFLL